MKKLAIVLALLLSISAFSLFGCANSIDKLTKIPKYRSLTTEVDRIEIDSYVGNYSKDDTWFKCVIEDKQLLEEIMTLFLTTPLEYVGNDLIYDIYNSKYTIIAGDKSYEISPPIRNGSHYYSFTDDAVWDKINEYLDSIGGRDTNIGMLFQITDTPDSLAQQIGFKDETTLGTYFTANLSHKYYYRALDIEAVRINTYSNIEAQDDELYETNITVPNGSSLAIYKTYLKGDRTENKYCIKLADTVTSEPTTLTYNYHVATVKINVLFE